MSYFSVETIPTSPTPFIEPLRGEEKKKKKGKTTLSRDELIIKDCKPHEETSYHKGELGGIRAGNNRML